MDASQMYQAYGQTKGTLVPGQTISVNKYTVQVERYLSQGGFAHVYLVRTATPVYNTTHHVLKRIAVSNEAMLTEVKKEVDIMRLLKGHQNIVHLIDAAWHRMVSGLFEVFILMEYCPGGGIIDMMNRRLRERLTEAEILQIFVDVCEGVAYMHNLRPPLLHRDLKVENILQASATSYKLCDFGSATTVSPRPPATTQEIRALEADLGRHTTLQYRAPEMVDPYLRRPVDEKSDVWALGVLLYKLCYYTTPFEEHGPLAILNVQYRIPPYPVYSPQLNALIASMLREHGTQRPSVFELLIHVHHLRGTKSPFHYTVPTPQPLAPRHQQSSTRAPAIESTKTYQPSNHSQQSLAPASTTPTMGQGVQAREKVLEAIAPMRRGRPSPSNAPVTNPQRSMDSPSAPERPKSWLDLGFPSDDQSWNPTMSKEGLSPSSKPAKGPDDAWGIPPTASTPKPENARVPGFADDFGDSRVWVPVPHVAPPSAKNSPQLPASNTDSAKLTAHIMRTAAYTGSDAPRLGEIGGRPKERDAFEGLGFTSAETKPAPTLAEARKLRTGLAMIGNNSPQNSALRPEPDKLSGFGRPSLSSRTTYLPQPQSRPSTPVPVPSPTIPTTQRVTHQIVRSSTSQTSDGLAAESRFPSLAELDVNFTPSTYAQSPAVPRHDIELYPSYLGQSNPQKRPMNLTAKASVHPPSQNDTKSALSIPQRVKGLEKTQSGQLTGGSTRDLRVSQDSLSGGSSSPLRKSVENLAALLSVNNTPASGSSSSRRNMSLGDELEPRARYQSPSLLGSTTINNSQIPNSTSNEDWLTGDNNSDNITTKARSFSPAPATSAPIVRDTPSKPASTINSPLGSIPGASTVQQGLIMRRTPSPRLLAYEDLGSPTFSRFSRAFPPIESKNATSGSTKTTSTPRKTDNKAGQRSISANSSEDEGPEDATGLKAGSSIARGSPPGKKLSRQNSVQDLVDHRDVTPMPPKDLNEKERETTFVRTYNAAASSSSSSASQSGLQKEKNNPSLTAPLSNSDYQRPPPLANLFLPETGRARRVSISRDRDEKQPSLGTTPVTSPISGRSRPQSMFIFPTKQPENSLTPGLAPPEYSKSRTSLRRTSISDMVQMYEAMESKARSSNANPPSPSAPKSPPFKSSNDRAGRYDGERLSISSNGMPRPSSPNSQPKSQSSPTLARASPIPRTSPSLIPSELPKHSQHSPRTSTSSLRQDPPKSGYALRKTTLEEPPRQSAANASSPSPEPTYQGVGKLIDQWQRKTAEAEAQNSVGTRKATPKWAAGVK